MSRDERTDLEDQADKAMRELDALMDVEPPFMLPTHHANLLAEQFIGLTRRFWALRNQGEVNQIVGDHAEAKSCFDQARELYKKRACFRELAVERGVEDDFDAVVGEYEAQEKEKVERMRTAAKKRAAKTGKAPKLVEAS